MVFLTTAPRTCVYTYRDRWLHYIYSINYLCLWMCTVCTLARQCVSNLAYIHSWVPVWLPRESSLETKPRRSCVALILPESNHRLLHSSKITFKCGLNYLPSDDDGEWIITIISSFQCLWRKVHFNLYSTWCYKRVFIGVFRLYRTGGYFC